MRENEFGEWLEKIYVTKNGTRLEKRPCSDAKSRCKRVEKYEGDLDSHFEKDKMQELISRLTYSRNDDESGISPPHSIPIEGDIYTGTASLRSAVKLYKEFCIYRKS